MFASGTIFNHTIALAVKKSQKRRENAHKNIKIALQEETATHITKFNQT